MGRIPLCRSFFILTPPVLLLIMSNLYNPHSWVMRRIHHIGERGILICRSDCRSATIFRLRCRNTILTNPNWGGVILAIILSSVRLRYDCRHRDRVPDRQGHKPFRSACFSISVRPPSLSFSITITHVAANPP